MLPSNGVIKFNIFNPIPHPLINNKLKPPFPTPSLHHNHAPNSDTRKLMQVVNEYGHHERARHDSR